MDDAELANNLIARLGVDVLIPVVASEGTSASDGIEAAHS
jgi:hypothetical protein